MCARENIRSAHTKVEKTLVDGRNLKGAKERNEYLTPGDSHFMPSAFGRQKALEANSLTDGNWPQGGVAP